MRLNRLDLTRYGKFTDFTLDFGPRPDGGPDLHILHGPNEAGKTTVLSAWMDLLFQIPTRSPMGFLHPYPSMQIGAELQIEGQAQSFVRIKKREASLLDETGAPVPEAVLQRALRGLDRGSYAAMFSLNRHSLEEGGESILASEGDLGALLFQASAGLSDLAVQLETVRKEADGFLSPSGRSGELKQLKQKAEELAAQIKETDTAAPVFAKLVREAQDRRAMWQDARTAADTVQVELREVDRLSRALPFSIDIAQRDAEIAAFRDLPEVPAGWMEELPALDRQEVALAVQLEHAKSAVKATRQLLGDLCLDTEVLKLQEQFAQAERLRAGHDTALEDLPKRKVEQDTLKDDVTAIVTHLGCAGQNPASLVPDVAVAARLRALIDAHTAVSERLTSAQKEQDAAARELEDLDQELAVQGDGLGVADALHGLLQRLQRDDPNKEMHHAQLQTDEADAAVLRCFERLRPFAGTLDQALQVPLPDAEQIRILGEQISAASQQAETCKTNLERLRDQSTELTNRQGHLTQGETGNVQQSARARSAREAAWRQHRETLSADSADTFEDAMRLDDQLSGLAARDLARAEEAAAIQIELEQLRREETESEVARDTAEKALAALEGQRIELLSDLLLPDHLSLLDLDQWLEQVQALRAADQHLQGRRKILVRARNAVSEAARDLRLALKGAGQGLDEQAGFAFVMERAIAVNEQRQNQYVMHETAQRARRNLQVRQRAVVDARAEFDRWQADWQSAIAQTPLGQGVPDVVQMRAKLDTVWPLGGLLSDIDKLSHRIRAMERNQDLFEQAVQALANALGAQVSGDALSDWVSLTQRLQLAQEMQRKHLETARTLEKQEAALAEAETERDLHQRRLQSFAQHFGTGSWPETRDTMNEANKRSQACQARRDAATRLCELLQVTTFEEANALVQAQDKDELAQRKANLEADYATLSQDRDTALGELRDAERALQDVGGDDSVAVLEEQRQALLLEIEERARRHLRQRLGLHAVEAALHRYRDTHRGGMLTRASEVFSQMTGRRYSGLVTRADGAKETLVALSADGGSKTADQLSEGTRAQLFLALRIAGYHEFQGNSGSVPFLADDIMESFDDARAIETFRLLAEMSAKGQVIYLTHHAHVRDLAREACAQVQVHEMPA